MPYHTTDTIQSSAPRALARPGGLARPDVAGASLHPRPALAGLLDQRLSPHFTLYPFLVSQQAARLGLDNTPPAYAISNLKLLALNLLEAIHAQFSRRGELTITSGYRSAGLNRLISGSPHSQHLRGQAADFYLQTGKSTRMEVPLLEVFDWVRHSSLLYDQLILEFPESGGWLHISYASPSRGQALVAHRRDGKVIYEAV